MEESWYQTLRAQWRPPHIRTLLIGESAPDASAAPAERRFFYAPTLTRHDPLFRGTVEAMYGATKLSAGESKQLWLRRLRDDGVYLIDLVPYPVNALAPSARSRARREHTAACVSQVEQLQPDGVLVCHGPTFSVLEKPLQASLAPLLHDTPIPFPLGNHRARFVAEVRRALAPQGVDQHV